MISAVTPGLVVRAADPAAPGQTTRFFAPTTLAELARLRAAHPFGGGSTVPGLSTGLADLVEELGAARADAILGSAWTNFIAVCIVIATAVALAGSGQAISSAAEAATALTRLVEQEKGELAKIDEDVMIAIRDNSILSEKIQDETEPELTFGEKMADHIATFGGSWTFILAFFGFLVCWILVNIASCGIFMYKNTPTFSCIGICKV